MTAAFIYHTCARPAWSEALARGIYEGSPADKADGFIHFSTAAQVAGSVAKHHAGRADLVLLTVAAERLGEALRWEPARGGQLFPHLYGVLPVAAVARVDDLPLGPEGHHLFPPLAG